MATSSQFDVGTTAQQVASGLGHAVVQNQGPYEIFLGGSGVSESAGFRIGPTQQLDLPIGLVTLEKLYAIAGSGAGGNTSDVRVLSYSG